MKNRIHKHTRRIVLFILLLAVAFGGCQRGVRVRGELAMLDSLVDVDYDSALSVLVQLDTRQMGKGERMYAQLLTGKAMNKADSLFTTDSVMKEVVRYFDRHGNSNQRMLAHYVLGCAYRDMGDAPRALQCYQDAVEQADTTRSDCDHSTLMRVHSQMSTLYRKQRLTDDARKEAAEGARIAWNIGDTLSALRLEQDKVIGLYNEERYEECIEAAKNFQEKCLRCQRIGLADIVNVFILKSCLKLHDYEQAKIYLDRYEAARVWQENSTRVNGGFGALYFYKGSYFKGIGQTDSAEYYYQKSLLSQGPGFEPIITYKGLCDIYETTGPVDSLYKYTKLYVAEHARKYDEETMTTMAQMQSLYNYNHSLYTLHQNEKKAHRLSVLLQSVSAILLLVVALFLLRRKRRKDRDLLTLSGEVRRMQKELIEYGSREKMHIQEENRRYEELTTSIREKERQIDILQQHVRIANGEDQATKLYQSDIVSVLRKYLRNGIQPREQEWNRLVHTVDSLFPAFRQQMNAQSPLKPNAYRVCMLTKSGFSSTEIDSLMGKASGYASHSKERLLKQIFGEEGKAGDFEERLMHDV